jgi:hypothetical protein
MTTIESETRGKSRRIWGWLSAIVGVLFTLWGIAWMVLAVINYSDHDYAEIHGIVRSIILCLLGLAIGIPLFILRIWLLIRDGR